MKSSKSKMGFGNEIPPKVEHVRIYFQQKNLSIREADLFVNHCTEAGWKTISGATIRNWKVAANNWIWNHRSSNFF